MAGLQRGRLLFGVRRGIVADSIAVAIAGETASGSPGTRTGSGWIDAFFFSCPPPRIEFSRFPSRENRTVQEFRANEVLILATKRKRNISFFTENSGKKPLLRFCRAVKLAFVSLSRVEQMQARNGRSLVTPSSVSFIVQ